MGLDDRDYMKNSKGTSSGDDDDITLRGVAILVGKLIATFIVLIISFRVPPIWIKIPLAIAILYLGWRWVFRPSKNSRSAASAISERNRPSREQASARAESNGESILTHSESADDSTSDLPKRLIALDAAGEFGKAKSLIQSIEGEEFSIEQADELAIIAKNYFPVRLEPTERGARLILE